MMDRNEELKGYLERRNINDGQKWRTKRIFRKEEKKGYLERRNIMDI